MGTYQVPFRGRRSAGTLYTAGGLVIALANLVWIGLMVKYRAR